MYYYNRVDASKAPLPGPHPMTTKATHGIASTGNNEDPLLKQG